MTERWKRRSMELAGSRSRRKSKLRPTRFSTSSRWVPSPQRLRSPGVTVTVWLVLEAREGPISVHPVTASLKSLQTIRGVLAKATRPDGSDVWLQIDAVPQLEPSGEVTRVVASMADVSHLFARSRLTSRSAGDHIVSEVLAELADAGLETRSILEVVTRALSNMRPGTWVATLLNKDPSTSILEV